MQLEWLLVHFLGFFTKNKLNFRVKRATYCETEEVEVSPEKGGCAFHPIPKLGKFVRVQESSSPKKSGAPSKILGIYCRIYIFYIVVRNMHENSCQINR